MSVINSQPALNEVDLPITGLVDGASSRQTHTPVFLRTWLVFSASNRKEANVACLNHIALAAELKAAHFDGDRNRPTFLGSASLCMRSGLPSVSSD